MYHQSICVRSCLRVVEGGGCQVVNVDGGGELVGVIVFQVGSCSCSCCCQVAAIRLTAATAVVAIVRADGRSPRVVESGRW
jgi:hypothetical protein